MKKKINIFALLISGVLLLVSCLNDDDTQVDYYQDAAMTSFELGTLNQYLHTTSSTGTDSIYKTTLTGSNYHFYIDQKKHEVYNPDSLPYGTDAAHVLCTVTAKNSGSIIIKNVDSDTLNYYNSTDSIDFTSDRQFQIYSNSGASHVVYTVKVNVHKQEPNVMNWTSLGTASDIAALVGGMKAVAFGGKIYVFGSTGSAAKAYSTSESDGKTWATLTPNIPSMTANAYKSLTVKGDKMFILNAGKVYSSTNGTAWTRTGTTSATQLVGASGNNLYAVSAAGDIMMSTNNGSSWSNCTLDDSKTYMPTENINFLSQKKITNDNTNQLVLLGNRNNTTDAVSMVWGKTEEANAGSNEQGWAYYNVADDNKYPAPRLENMQAVVYDNSIMAIGGAGTGKCTATAFDNFYRSADNGITWQPYSVMTFPTGFSSNQKAFSMTVDSSQCLWIVCGTSGQVWKGRINKLGWAPIQDVFNN